MLQRSEEWWLKRARVEADVPIGAGTGHQFLDPRCPRCAKLLEADAKAKASAKRRASK